ncbi:MAG: signal peptidase II [Rhodospirillales bacterium]|nr:signal peptidase II [Rhodospirillales bacterium]
MSDSPVSPVTKAPQGAFLRQGFGVILFILILDQISKWVVLDLFGETPRMIEVLPFFNLVLVRNQGISFGMFGGSSAWGAWILTGLALVISAFLFFWLKKAETRLAALSLAAIIGGALGNVIDRVRFGAVVDFLDFHVLGYHWPAFNVADCAITVGAATLILESLFSGGEKP